MCHVLILSNSCRCGEDVVVGVLQIKTYGNLEAWYPLALTESTPQTRRVQGVLAVIYG